MLDVLDPDDLAELAGKYRWSGLEQVVAIHMATHLDMYADAITSVNTHPHTHTCTHTHIHSSKSV